QPGKLAAFGVLFSISVLCDLATPVIAGRLVEALAQGPAAGAEAATSAYGLFIAAALGFYVFRNIGVRFWTPLAARNMSAIVGAGLADV
ncbi:hypothetical protein, partial [Aphanothece microscopica]|uniref:hypothetical protein n=1 Tax=Aphanothece microscopica TaxID=1049561 RepID=UPI003985290F